MKELLTKMRPEVFEDIIALVALYRPGPLESGMVDDFVARKHGEKRVTYLLPELEPILKETYGVIVYQEQVMEISRCWGATPWDRATSCAGPWARRTRRSWPNRPTPS